MSRTVTLELPEDSHTAFFSAANALHELAGEHAPSPEQLMVMAVNPETAADLYAAFIQKAKDVLPVLT